jgi:hypothetical protein
MFNYLLVLICNLRLFYLFNVVELIPFCIAFILTTINYYYSRYQDQDQHHLSLYYFRVNFPFKIADNPKESCSVVVVFPSYSYSVL